MREQHYLNEYEWLTRLEDQQTGFKLPILLQYDLYSTLLKCLVILLPNIEADSITEVLLTHKEWRL